MSADAASTMSVEARAARNAGYRMEVSGTRGELRTLIQAKPRTKHGNKMRTNCQPLFRLGEPPQERVRMNGTGRGGIRGRIGRPSLYAATATIQL